MRSVAHDKRRKANVLLTAHRHGKGSTPNCSSVLGTIVGGGVSGDTNQVIVVHTLRRATLPLSSSMFTLKLLFALVALLLVASVRAVTNVTIDDTDPRIAYRPSWSFQADVRPLLFSGIREYFLTCAADGQHARSV